MSEDAAQEQRVTVSGVVTRLMPCAEHRRDPPGEQTHNRNPNGYRHDCPACAATPRHTEALEGVE